MYAVKVEYQTKDHKGKVHDRKQTIILAPRSGEKIITVMKVAVVTHSAVGPFASI